MDPEAARRSRLRRKALAALGALIAAFLVLTCTSLGLYAGFPLCIWWAQRLNAWDSGFVAGIEGIAKHPGYFAKGQSEVVSAATVQSRSFSATVWTWPVLSRMLPPLPGPWLPTRSAAIGWSFAISRSGFDGPR